MAPGKVQGHLYEHDALGIAVGGARLAVTQVSETLVQAGLKRQAKGPYAPG
jgi:hypothetical protein